MARKVASARVGLRVAGFFFLPRRGSFIGGGHGSISAMIHLAVAPIALAVLAVAAWRNERRARRAYEATLSAAEKRQFRSFRRVRPSEWRALMALGNAERELATDKRERVKRLRLKT
jgi:hypothetical protein